MKGLAMSEDLGTIWVCVDCMLTHANGECGEDPDQEPLSAIPAGHTVTLGMAEEDHSDDCQMKITGGQIDCDRDCARIDFTMQSCEGCGSILHGERHALTLWREVSEETAKASTKAVAFAFFAENPSPDILEIRSDNDPESSVSIDVKSPVAHVLHPTGELNSPELSDFFEAWDSALTEHGWRRLQSWIENPSTETNWDFRAIVERL